MTRPKLAHSNPDDPVLRRLHEEMTELGRILPVRSAPPPRKPLANRAEKDFHDVEDLFDNCPL
jgi:hypothetical protein